MSSTEINLAVYMERLDAYIESQNNLNTTLCSSLESVNENINDFKMWRSRLYGGKSVLVSIGILILHTAAVMGGFVALINFMSK